MSIAALKARYNATFGSHRSYHQEEKAPSVAEVKASFAQKRNDPNSKFYRKEWSVDQDKFLASFPYGIPAKFSDEYFIVSDAAKGIDAKLCSHVFVESDTGTIEEQRAKIKALGIKPEIILFTGNKSEHYYFRLAESEHSSLKWQKFIKKILCHAVGGDTSSVPVVHPMRLPGIKHSKTGNISKFKKVTAKEYTLVELDQILRPNVDPDFYAKAKHDILGFPLPTHLKIKQFKKQIPIANSPQRMRWQREGTLILTEYLQKFGKTGNCDYETTIRLISSAFSAGVDVRSVLNQYRSHCGDSRTEAFLRWLDKMESEGSNCGPGVLYKIWKTHGLETKIHQVRQKKTIEERDNEVQQLQQYIAKNLDRYHREFGNSKMGLPVDEFITRLTEDTESPVYGKEMKKIKYWEEFSKIMKGFGYKCKRLRFNYKYVTAYYPIFDAVCKIEPEPSEGEVPVKRAFSRHPSTYYCIRDHRGQFTATFQKILQQQGLNPEHYRQQLRELKSRKDQLQGAVANEHLQRDSQETS